MNKPVSVPLAFDLMLTARALRASIVETN
jgi:hypothetical protein